MKDTKEVLLGGLVLAGGKSVRMGKHKSTLDYHGVPQVEYLFRLLEAKTDKAYVSLGKGEKVSFTDAIILDRLEVKSSMNGIISALESDAASAWLVLAVDLPLITERTLDLLKSRRDPRKLATCMSRKGTGVPEPLIAIWEPKALPVLKEEAANVKYSPKRVLMQHDIELVEAPDDSVLFNANEQTDYEEAKKMIDAAYRK